MFSHEELCLLLLEGRMLFPGQYADGTPLMEYAGQFDPFVDAITNLVQRRKGSLISGTGISVFAVWPAESGSLNPSYMQVLTEAVREVRSLNDKGKKLGVLVPAFMLALGYGSCICLSQAGSYRSVTGETVDRVFNQLWAGARAGLQVVADATIASAYSEVDWTEAQAGVYSLEF